MPGILDFLRDFFSVVGLTLVLTILALFYKILMVPNAPTWEDAEVGIELSIASVGVVLGSLLTEATPYASARWLNAFILLLLITGAATFTKVRGHAQGTLTMNAMVVLNATGALTLIVTYGINSHPKTAHAWWHAVWG
ncbi:hypothetical protein ABZ957_15430 [Streptomyces sp. NPDC046316]|uniref:hypothetical protein n=1 Tax=Streptomyces sp. NPDC046316 TaxID=3154494 RepID=UPI0034100DD3